MDTTGITPVMPVGGNDGMFGGNGFMGIFGLLILVGLLNGGFGGFGGGNQQYATRDQVQNGFDNQNQQMLASGILGAVNNGTAQAVAATNQSFHDTLAAMQACTMRRPATLPHWASVRRRFWRTRTTAAARQNS